MRPLLDIHTHTIMSGHAYSTLHEMAQTAKDKGLQILGITEHAPSIPGTCDLDEFYYRQMDIRIAGIHSLCWQGGNAEENTQGMVNAIRNPWIHIISHPGDGTAELIFEPIVEEAQRHHTLLEINSSSLNPIRHKEQAIANNLKILNLCKQLEVPVILGSDAHISFDIANYQYALPLLKEVDFPEKLVMNHQPDFFLNYLGIPSSH